MSVPEEARKPARRRSRIVGTLPIKEVVGLIVGIAALVAAIVIALSVRELVGFPQWTVRLLASLGVALGCMSLTGFVELQGRILPFQIRAGGALAIFVAVLFVPPEIVLPPKTPLDVPKEDPAIVAQKALELVDDQNWTELDDLGDVRCTQGTKFGDLPAPVLDRPKKFGKPTIRITQAVMNDFFKTPPNDPVRVVVFEEIRPTGSPLSSWVTLVASGDDDAPHWALCGIFYAQPAPPSTPSKES